MSQTTNAWLLLEALTQQKYAEFLSLLKQYKDTGKASGLERVSQGVLDDLLLGYESYIASKVFPKLERLVWRAAHRGDTQFLGVFEIEKIDRNGRPGLQFRDTETDEVFDLSALEKEIHDRGMTKELVSWAVNNVADVSIGVTPDVLDIYQKMTDRTQQQYRMDNIVMAMEFVDKYFSEMGRFFGYVHHT